MKIVVFSTKRLYSKQKETFCFFIASSAGQCFIKCYGVMVFLGSEYKTE